MAEPALEAPLDARVLLIDNHDSFTYNIVQALATMGATVEVRYPEDMDPQGLSRLGPTHLVVSPGPGRPEDIPATTSLVEKALGSIPILGICLGHQTLGVVLGGVVDAAPRLAHGKTSEVVHDGDTIYRGVSNPFSAGRYHSLIIESGSLPDEVEVPAVTKKGDIMGLRHRSLRAEGVQFHPESVLTPEGGRLLRNFLLG